LEQENPGALIINRFCYLTWAEPLGCNRVIQVFLWDLQFGRVGQKPVLLPDLGWTVKSKVVLIAEFQFTRQQLFSGKKQKNLLSTSLKKLK
jgi:hypothetical protein